MVNGIHHPQSTEAATAVDSNCFPILAYWLVPVDGFYPVVVRPVENVLGGPSGFRGCRDCCWTTRMLRAAKVIAAYSCCLG